MKTGVCRYDHDRVARLDTVVSTRNDDRTVAVDKRDQKILF